MIERCIAVIEVLVKQTTFHLLEVDTSDAINSLSTQVLVLSLPSDWRKLLGELERELQKNHLSG